MIYEGKIEQNTNLCAPSRAAVVAERGDLSCIYSVLHFPIRLPFTPDPSRIARWPNNLFWAPFA